MEHSDRGRYVTEQVSLWICNEGDHFQKARRYASAGIDDLENYLVAVIRVYPKVNSAPWHLALELAPNDYNRIDWQSVADDLLQM